jgi:protocatechuate 3,4-dioxygenase beta subunit
VSIEQRLTDETIARMSGSQDARLVEVMTRLLVHLHDFVREIRPSQEEWMAAIRFLTETGQTCSDTRQEYILLSDVLGVSMLVDAVNHEASPGATESTVLGPFYTGVQPTLPFDASIDRTGPGPSARVSGRVLGAGGTPIAGAQVEVWQASPAGLYDVQDPAQPPGNLRATFVTEPDGRYAFRTLVPECYPIPDDGPVGKLLRAIGRHPWRPAHVHFLITAPGYRRLVTHIFLAGGRYLDSDAVFGVKPSLVVEPHTADGAVEIAFDFTLDPA